MASVQVVGQPSRPADRPVRATAPLARRCVAADHRPDSEHGHVSRLAEQGPGSGWWSSRRRVDSVEGRAQIRWRRRWHRIAPSASSRECRPSRREGSSQRRTRRNVRRRVAGARAPCVVPYLCQQPTNACKLEAKTRTAWLGGLSPNHAACRLVLPPFRSRERLRMAATSASSTATTTSRVAISRAPLPRSGAPSRQLLIRRCAGRS